MNGMSAYRVMPHYCRVVLCHVTSCYSRMLNVMICHAISHVDSVVGGMKASYQQVPTADVTNLHAAHVSDRMQLPSQSH